MSSARLHSIVRRILSEVREFSTVDVEVDESESLTGPQMIREIRNALWMPNGITAHARVLLAAGNIDPRSEYPLKDDPFDPWRRKPGMTRETSLSRLVDELTLLDMHMEEFIRARYSMVVGERGDGSVPLRTPPGVDVRRRDDRAVSYTLFEVALRGSMRSNVDTPSSRQAHTGGRYDPTRHPQWSQSQPRDIADAIVEDFLEILLSPEDAPERIDFDKAATHMQALVDKVAKGAASRSDLAPLMRAALDREAASARSKLLQAEHERGARVPDSANHEIVKNIGDILTLFHRRVVSSAEVQPSEMGEIFATMLAKSCGIDSESQLPAALRSMPIRPLLPKRVDDGIVDFVDAVHEEVERQVGEMKNISAVSRLILDPTQDIYSKDGSQAAPHNERLPHPDYD